MRGLQLFLLLLLVSVYSLPSYSSHEGHDISKCPVHKVSGQYIISLEHASAQVWTQALSASAVVGLVPILFLWILPVKHTQARVLSLALAFAAGGLLADVFLHLVPHSISHAMTHNHEHEHHHEHEGHGHGHGHGDHIGTLGSNILVGILVFFIIDKCVRIASSNVHAHGHDSDALHKKTDSDQKHGKVSMFSSGILLNLVADFAHNITDGLAIGAAFASAKNEADVKAAYLTVLAILVHELPHELGDMALLIKSGMSKGSAMLMQVFTAVGCLVGTFLGVAIESSGDADEHHQSWIIPFTAGGFLYISLSVIIPELLSNENAPARKGSAFRVGVLQIVLFYAGIYFMQVVSAFE